MVLGHLLRMDESDDAKRILTAVPWNDWKLTGRLHILAGHSE